MASVTGIGSGVRAGIRFLKGSGGMKGPVQVRNGSGDVHITPRYRQFPELTKSQVRQAHFLSGFMWFWILWHFWHNSEAVLGHFPYPDSSKWTDEELGIPPDDED
ncbi:NADH dehydrogenase [ubiquinone] 1 beta subcomplex subunit 2, mitochondrial [Microcaecilia unicolor]|uniref:NADH dehydrogenase [ubiquinone] 1 beta subcomplex subunit 2, mitochondrial n=1 Tax=Microcaecilia unicolor TaxID=1415580 RepID=A0A6P7YZ37_9AMPH|nr:NADH dehydrogenase [ubiquinone] 1 beta subcomplex subunit 2, mitochondrial [Microcaecilia unicolor]